MRAALPPVGVEHPDEDQLDTHRRYIEGMRKFAVGRWTSSGVPQDTVNVWNANHAAIDAPAYRYIIEPVATFEEHTRSVWAHDPEVAEYLLKESNPETVARLDTLAATFNTALEQYRNNEADNESVESMSNAAKAAVELIQGGEK